ncbi:unnamed protein product [[Actinomadura] parvosata subsp. kistnae]|uniref:WYL domain-containing protein n=1 Tax=[Actinomadura] parvosata subsp. kistnae TaxID=1909395 RepID=A0A1V0A0D1_9ACTN|nr:hypothetical protein BKM31_21390 [Nonomuraea sp. ATCC 55076]SPL99466.1 unnamed protein product [Actinomadura parvosata subsp. kistnae]
MSCTGDGEPATLTLEPHDLVVWAARWYLVAYDPAVGRRRAMRVDRIRSHPPTHTPSNGATSRTATPPPSS